MILCGVPTFFCIFTWLGHSYYEQVATEVLQWSMIWLRDSGTEVIIISLDEISLNEVLHAEFDMNTAMLPTIGVWSYNQVWTETAASWGSIAIPEWAWEMQHWI